jgi:hypothetical protein
MASWVLSVNQCVVVNDRRLVFAEFVRSETISRFRGYFVSLSPTFVLLDDREKQGQMPKCQGNTHFNFLGTPAT